MEFNFEGLISCCYRKKQKVKDDSSSNVRDKKGKYILSIQRDNGKDWMTQRQVRLLKIYFQKMDKILLTLRIITGALLDKGKIKRIRKKKEIKTRFKERETSKGKTKPPRRKNHEHWLVIVYVLPRQKCH